MLFWYVISHPSVYWWTQGLVSVFKHLTSLPNWLFTKLPAEGAMLTMSPKAWVWRMSFLWLYLSILVIRAKEHPACCFWKWGIDHVASEKGQKKRWIVDHLSVVSHLLELDLLCVCALHKTKWEYGKAGSIKWKSTNCTLVYFDETLIKMIL